MGKTKSPFPLPLPKVRAMIFAQARKKGLKPEDADDCTQDILLSLMQTTAKYDPEKGDFEAWLYTTARNRVRNYWHKHLRLMPTQVVANDGEDTVLDAIPAATLDAATTAANRDELEQFKLDFEAAANAVKHEFSERTWQAFWMRAVQGLNTTLIKVQLDMTQGAIDVANTRVMQRIRKEMIEQKQKN